MDTKSKALTALISTVFLWSILVVVARGVVTEIRPMSLLFLRLLVATISFVPFLIYSKPWQNKKFFSLVGVSVFSAINLVFFIWGIQYTSASASQLIYAVMPILIVFINIILLKEDIPPRRIIGVVTGLLGIFFVVFLSAIEKGTTIAGSLIGNLAMTVAMLGWVIFIILTKRLSKTFSPMEISSVSVLVSFIISIPLLIIEIIWFKFPLYIQSKGIFAAIYMGFFGTFLTYLLHQYAIRYLSPLTVSLTSYVQPITVTFLAMMFLGEKLTPLFLLGSVLVFLGIFLTTTFEIYRRRK